MRCGRETMCSPCWNASPDEAWAICEAVFELQGEVGGNIARRDLVEARIGEVCAQTEALLPNFTISRGVEVRLEQDGIEVYPLNRMLTELELDE